MALDKSRKPCYNNIVTHSFDILLNVLLTEKQAG